ncbi:MAG: asparagine synthase (glutamine-hydrolyzing) [Chitinophagaceae bacterium]
MCGIAGIIQSAPAYHPEHIQKMTGALSHRAPDGQSFWKNEDGTVLLGHGRLSIIDLTAAAAQPMHYLNRYTIIHNGEIYNYIELKKELIKQGYSFTTQSDTEVILAAYDMWDDECVEHFDGMFAFVIWDEKEKELFAARDRFGEKPLFYYQNNDQFLFASEMKALWAAGIQRTANLKMLFNFITIGYVDNPARTEETFFEHIFKLPPASRLYYTPATRELFIEKYWDIDPDIQTKKISDNEAIEQFNELFLLSIQRRLRSDVTVGTSLSGGLDSSSIAAAISQTTNSPLSSFTAGFPGFEKDETTFSKAVASQFHLNQNIVSVSADQLATDWENLCWHQEEPVGSASVFAQYKVFELAKEKNVKVLLDGQGADETLAGYHKYYKWYWQELFQKRALSKSGEVSAAQKIGVQESFGIKNIIASLFPDLASVILERRYLVNALKQEYLHRDFVRLQSKEAYYSAPSHEGLNGRLYFNTFVHGLEELLRYADRNSMAHGREVRLPFLSHQLVEFIFSLPSNFKIRDGWTKWLLRKTMDKKLPDQITWRKDKTGFEPPQHAWMQHQKIKEMIQEARKKLVNEKILHENVLNKTVGATSAYEADAYDWRYFSAAACL